MRSPLRLKSATVRSRPNASGQHEPDLRRGQRGWHVDVEYVQQVSELSVELDPTSATAGIPKLENCVLG